jgi:PBP/GOBP family
LFADIVITSGTLIEFHSQCFVKCFFKRTGFMNEAGEPQKDVIIEKLKNKAGSKYEKLEELIEKCVKETAENECDLAFKIFECYWTNRVVKTIEAAKTA